VYWLHSDHLGSASLTTDAGGGKFAELRYKPWGEVRWSSGAMPTDRRFTGMTTHAGLGLVTMGVREYLPSLGRWLSADTIVPRPGDPQAFNRFSYVRNSPVNRVDISGHDDWRQDETKTREWNEARGYFWNGTKYEFRQGQARYASVTLLNDLLAEAGITNKYSALTWDAIYLAQTVADISNKVGGASQLKSLLGGGGVNATIIIRDYDPTDPRNFNRKSVVGDPFTGKAWSSKTFTVYLGRNVNTNLIDAKEARNVIAHEIGHLINDNSQTYGFSSLFGLIDNRYRHYYGGSNAGRHALASNGASQRNEDFADDFTDWIYSSDQLSVDVANYFQKELAKK
jgi:RHS repeat-associated protein